MTTTRRRRIATIAVASFGAMVGLTATAAAKAPKPPPPVCKGTSVLDGLSTNNPETFAEIEARASKIPNAEAMLWRIEKPGIEPSHLFGTMHVTDPRIATLSPRVNAAIATAKTVALELADLSPEGLGAAIAGRPDLIVYTDGQRLDKKLSAAEFAIARKVLGQAGIPPEAASGMRPWFVHLMLATPLCEALRMQAGLDFLDARIANAARARKVPVIGLETPLDQITAMASISDADQIRLLRISLAFADRREDMLETLVELYRARRLHLALPLSDAIARLEGLDISGNAAFENKAITKRNYGMRNRALPLLEKGRAFVAVGALHLIGDTGLVALFREAGFKVTAIE